MQKESQAKQVEGLIGALANFPQEIAWHSGRLYHFSK